MKSVRAILAAFIFAGFTAAAQSEPVEFIFVLKNQTGTQQIPDSQLVRMQDQAEAECRFETNKAAAAAGHIVVPGSPGISVTGSSPLAGSLGNLATAMTATGSTILPGMTDEQMWQLFISCFEAKGYAVVEMPQFQAMKADFQSTHPGQRVRGVAKTYDFR